MHPTRRIATSLAAALLALTLTVPAMTTSTSSFVTTAAPVTGTSSGMLGYMFWAGERPSTRGVTTAPPNTCEAGVGAGATRLTIPLPMPPLRQA